MALEPLFDARDLPRLPPSGGVDAAGALQLLREHEVRFLHLQFADIFGVVKGMEVPPNQFERALAGELMFDGSSMEGTVRVEELDMYLRPDPQTLCILPWSRPGNRGARLVCDVHRPDGTPFEGDPRGALRRTLAKLREQELEALVGLELEFFLFEGGPDGGPMPRVHDRGGYYDLAPSDRGGAVRRDMVEVLEAMGFATASAHHEVAPGQHKIDLHPAAALASADAAATLRLVVHNVALRHGLRASFMPKPVPGQNGSGLHAHHLLRRGGENLFFDPEGRDQLSLPLRHYVGGLLKHARGLCAITNPLVNSYKRLVPGHQAPVNVAWSLHNRSPMVRIPIPRGADTRCEVRIADSSTNPYLALAVQIAAGLDGLRRETDPGDPVNKNLWTLTQRERQRLRIAELPRTLGEALDELERDRVVRGALGEYIFSHFTQAMRAEWEQYLAQVHPWEIERYL